MRIYYIIINNESRSKTKKKIVLYYRYTKACVPTEFIKSNMIRFYHYWFLIDRIDHKFEYLILMSITMADTADIGVGLHNLYNII